MVGSSFSLTCMPLSLSSSPAKALHVQPVIVQVSNILFTCSSPIHRTLAFALPLSPQALSNQYLDILPSLTCLLRPGPKLLYVLCVGQSLFHGLLSFSSEREYKLHINTFLTSQYIIIYFSQLFPPQLFSSSDKLFQTFRTL